MVYLYRLLENEREIAILHDGLVRRRDVITVLRSEGWSDERIESLFVDRKDMACIEKEITDAENELNDIHHKIRQFIAGAMVL